MFRVRTYMGLALPNALILFSFPFFCGKIHKGSVIVNGFHPTSYLHPFQQKVLPNLAFISHHDKKAGTKSINNKLFANTKNIHSDNEASKTESIPYENRRLKNTTCSFLEKLKQGGGIVSPQEIIFSSFFPVTSDDEPSCSKKIKSDNDIFSDALPLFSAVNILNDSLNSILEMDDELLMNLFSDKSSMKNHVTIRIDQRLIHNSEGSNLLQWLKQIQGPTTASDLTASAMPKVYFADSQHELETAGYGTAGSLLLTGDFSLSKSDWDTISSLPAGIKLYGGGRFDPNLPLGNRGDEWKLPKNHNGFRGFFYMLPTVELRKEKLANGFVSLYLSVNLHFNRTDNGSFRIAAQHALDLLRACPKSSSAIAWSAPPNLPPILFRNEDTPSEEEWERGIQATLESTNVTKTVLSRRADLLLLDSHVQHYSNNQNLAIDMLLRMKWVGHVGHFFYLEPGGGSGAFCGCTPEKLFKIDTCGRIQSEALAGTRTRGTDNVTDTALASELLFSAPKDMKENSVTKDYIHDVFRKLETEGRILFPKVKATPFVRRLKNLQHICVSINAEMSSDAVLPDVARFLLENLHPTPAVGGFPKDDALNIIREYESHDRGYYAGPFGYLGSDSTEIVVAIRSSLLTHSSVEFQRKSKAKFNHGTILSVYAGAGIVDGSTPQGEWTETSHKLGTLSSVFSPAPITLDRSPTANSAFSTTFIEELIRCGVNLFLVCPGSRSTPLVAAVSKAVKNTRNVGVVRAVSIHDERGAGFRAIGYARRSGKPAAVITSSGTAVGNLLPAVMEANQDGIPLVLLTADRPYEARGTGANQAVDQLKVFSSQVRWFRDIPPPSGDSVVSIAPALADANYAVSASLRLLGPVHVNIQFRENLAPDTGPIRGDDRIGSFSQFSATRYTDVPGFQRWANSGLPWQLSYTSGHAVDQTAVREVSELIINSKRGIIVVGHVRVTGNEEGDQSTAADVICDFASSIGFPIFSSVMSGSLRNGDHSAVVAYAEHLLKNPKVSQNMNPDLILQIGSPLISTEIPKIIKSAVGGRSHKNSVNQSAKDSFDEKNGGDPFVSPKFAAHVIIQPLAPGERADPDFTSTHMVHSFAVPFLRAVLEEVRKVATKSSFEIHSELSALILAGQYLRKHMPTIVHEASSYVVGSQEISTPIDGKGEDSGFDKNVTMPLTEPQVVLAISEVLSEEAYMSSSLFLSNSMPVRDAEFFFYPNKSENEIGRGVVNVGVNRGASGIDGIISAARGYSEGVMYHNRLQQTREDPKKIGTTLLVGDLASLHDINGFHGIQNSGIKDDLPSPSLTTIVVNNNGGGIFSFLPVARHTTEVGFEEFFGTPTDSFSFEQGAKAFGLSYKSCTNFGELKELYRQCLKDEEPFVIEAKVVERSMNVEVHTEITKRTISAVDEFLLDNVENDEASKNPPPTYDFFGKNISQMNYESSTSILDDSKYSKIMVLLHGWMGDRSDWNQTATSLANELPSEWTLIAFDLPGHGNTKLEKSSESNLVRISLNLDDMDKVLTGPESDKTKMCSNLSIDYLAQSVIDSLNEMNITYVDALCGYSLGGRVALAMNRICQSSFDKDNLELKEQMSLLSEDTKLILLSVNPGDIPVLNGKDRTQTSSTDRYEKDKGLHDVMMAISARSYVQDPSFMKDLSLWGPFLVKWYKSKIWGRLQEDNSSNYQRMLSRKLGQLRNRGTDLASVLMSCSPPLNSLSDWRFIKSESTLYLAGNLDEKYSKLGQSWSAAIPGITYKEIGSAGHALLAEKPLEVARVMKHFLLDDVNVSELPIDILSNRIWEKALDIEKRESSDSVKKLERHKSKGNSTIMMVKPGVFDFEAFAVNMITDKSNSEAPSGIGWGNSTKLQDVKLERRKGYILQILSIDGSMVGVGEISPLPGLHRETYAEAGTQLNHLRDMIATSQNSTPEFNANSIVTLEGALVEYVEQFAEICGIKKLFPSVKSGLEMSILALASQALRLSLPQAISSNSPLRFRTLNESPPTMLQLNGLVPRSASKSTSSHTYVDKTVYTSFQSIKVKVGHQSIAQDVQSILKAFIFLNGQPDGTFKRKVRADANRGWNESSANEFSSALKVLGPDIIENMEFVEEPLHKVFGFNENITSSNFSFSRQVRALEKWHRGSGLTYALDESLVELAESFNYNFDAISESLRDALTECKGCAALVLKPSILGLELSARLARMAQHELKISAVFSSSFDSGVGLAHCAFICASSIIHTGEYLDFAHGLGTFDMLGGDTLTPSFGSYVNGTGYLNVLSLARAMYGLGLDEMRETLTVDLSGSEPDDKLFNETENIEYKATSSTSSSGREISVTVSLPLPFSDVIACSSFSDLPQMSRWSPWLSSVEYIPSDGETEWTLNVRGNKLQWRAVSTVTDNPKGIVWESVSGLKNKGVVEFIPSSDSTCVMSVKMKILVPRVVALIFRGTSVFVEDFLQNKLLKWSLEMFRDIVKADLALERGDAELGDALFGAVEGRANAIEATLSRSENLPEKE